MDLKSLVTELDYQKEFSLEKRYELFNKYGINHQKVAFNPILELAHLARYGSVSTSGISGYSHSGWVLSEFNKSLKEASSGPVKLQNNYVSITDHSITVSEYIQGSYNKPVEERFRKIVRFNIKNKTVSLYTSDYISVPRGLYEKIDEFLIDLGYEAWS